MGTLGCNVRNTYLIVDKKSKKFECYCCRDYCKYKTPISQLIESHFRILVMIVSLPHLSRDSLLSADFSRNEISLVLCVCFLQWLYMMIIGCYIEGFNHAI